MSVELNTIPGASLALVALLKYNTLGTSKLTLVDWPHQYIIPYKVFQ
jgi:hypothetical protein